MQCSVKRRGTFKRAKFSGRGERPGRKVATWRNRWWPGELFTICQLCSTFQQDWLTLLSFEKPGLINILPCEFNRCRLGNAINWIQIIKLSNVREEHRPGECHGDTVEEWEVRDAAFHHCPGIIRLPYHYLIIRFLYHYLIIRSTINVYVIINFGIDNKT